MYPIINSEGFKPAYDAYGHKPQEKTYGKWLVYANGTMFYDNRIYIPVEKVLEDDTWVIHFLGCEEIDFNDFIPAYLQACKNAGRKRITVRTYF